MDITETFGKNSSVAPKTETAATVTETSATPEQTSTPKAEAAGQSDDWSLDSALKEIKKLREENKTRREKLVETEQHYKTLLEQKQIQEQEELKAALEAKKELERLKEEQADKKRSLEEKLSVREQRLQEYELMMKQKETEAQSRLSQYEKELQDLRLEREARISVQKAEVERELGAIPETHREFAQLMIKGAESPEVALLTLREAKVRGLFDEKKISVLHATPNASSGARTSQEDFERQRREQLKAKGSLGLIKEGLKESLAGRNTAGKLTR